MMSEWGKKTACILCSQDCGIEVELDGRRLARIRGDRAHPASQGYTCEKALRLDAYQNARDRLTSPLRRRPDGTFEQIDWDTAIREVAQRFAALRDQHGGETIFYYGGGGQGNHPRGAHGRATPPAPASPPQLPPGPDAFSLSALLAIPVQEDLAAHAFLRDRTRDFDRVRAALAATPVSDYAARAGLAEPLLREVARRIARAKSVATFE